MGQRQGNYSEILIVWIDRKCCKVVCYNCKPTANNECQKIRQNQLVLEMRHNTLLWCDVKCYMLLLLPSLNTTAVAILAPTVIKRALSPQLWERRFQLGTSSGEVLIISKLFVKFLLSSRFVSLSPKFITNPTKRRSIMDCFSQMKLILTFQDLFLLV